MLHRYTQEKIDAVKSYAVNEKMQLCPNSEGGGCGLIGCVCFQSVFRCGGGLLHSDDMWLLCHIATVTKLL